MSELNSLEISVKNDFVGDATVPNEVQEEEMEEGEASEDEVEVNVIINHPKENNISFFGDANHSLMSGRIFEDGIEAISDNSIDEKFDERAQRFGEVSKPGYLSKENLQKLYKSLSLCESDFNRGGWRAEALLVKGIEKQTKQDIFTYFSDFSPQYLEWIGKDECNVVFPKSAAPALYNLSCPIDPKPQNSMKIIIDNPIQKPVEERKEKKAIVSQKPAAKSDSSDSDSSDSDSDSSDSTSESDDEASSSSSSESSDSSSEDSSSSEDDAEMEDEGESYGPQAPAAVAPAKAVESTATAADIAVDVPSVGRWRLGVPFAGAKAVFMRFAHCKDRKVLGLKNTIEIFDSAAKDNSTRYSVEPRRRAERAPREPKIYNRLGRNRDSKQPSRMAPPQFFEETATKNYQDLDDPVGTVVPKNPWGYLAENWTSRETQQNMDYQALLRQHVFEKPKYRKRTLSDYEEDCEMDMHPAKRLHSIRPRGREYMQAAYDYSEESDASDDVVEWNAKVKIPRMKMYADDEERRQKKRAVKPNHCDTVDFSSRSAGRRRLPRPPHQQRQRFDLRQKLSQNRK